MLRLVIVQLGRLIFVVIIVLLNHHPMRENIGTSCWNSSSGQTESSDMPITPTTKMDTMIRKQLDGDEEEHCSYAMQLVNSASLPMVLNAAIELGLLEIIAKAGPGAHLSPIEISSQIPTTNAEAPTMLDRILQFLASYSVLTCSVSDCDGHPQRMYGLAPVAKYFVRNEDGASLGPLLALVQDKVFIDSWYELKSAVLEGGIPFNKVHGAHAFEYPGRDPRFNEVFNKAMKNQTTIVMKKILESYKGFELIRKLVDVGGGLGVSLNMITSKYPAIKGINFDLPHVIQHAASYPGIEHLGGDMFESVPEGDVIFMKWILHDWSDDDCLKLLKNCYKAVPDNGKVIVVEGILPVLPDTSSAVISMCELDVVMMTVNPGGKERTQQEFLTLATGAGFAGIRMDCFTCNFWVMEFYK
ncbi:caffeic acid 3-O-methyltransferase-like [Cornus florida]|uniref:caffeic acid 3-O-methyltransferase-like n=1 Tax=Cornus florida TaxID=4283 RepID=UPI002899708E|nr:caffeic acid 3-O-methyltransferase-like [Cornus florida]